MYIVYNFFFAKVNKTFAFLVFNRNEKKKICLDCSSNLFSSKTLDNCLYRISFFYYYK